MRTKYFIDASGSYIGAFTDGATPPSNSFEVFNPPLHGKQIWSNGSWLPLEKTKEEQQEARVKSYATEADPLFFKWQAGEATEYEWLSKRAEIRNRYPYPSE